MYPHLKNLTYVSLIIVLVKCGVRKEHKLQKLSDLELKLGFAT